MPRQLQWPADPDHTPGDRAAKRFTTLHQVLVLRASHLRSEVGRLSVFGQHVVRDLLLQVEAISQTDELTSGELLDLMRRVAGLDFRSKCPALDRLGEDHCRATFVFCLLYTSPSPRDRTRSRMPSSA